jgi:hypothetical protein
MARIIFLVVGLIAGGRQQDLLLNLLIGVVGTLAGGLASLLGLGAYTLVREIVIATLGAIFCLYVWRACAEAIAAAYSVWERPHSVVNRTRAEGKFAMEAHSLLSMPGDRISSAC